MKHVFAVLSLLAMAACDGNPFPTDGAGGDPDTPPANNQTVVVPAALLGNIQKVVYTPGASSDQSTLKVQITGLDTTPLLATWTRNPDLDVKGYRAFSVQEDSLDRMFVGLAKASADGAVSAVVAGDGGQFGSAFSGTSYSRTGAFTPPPSTGSGPATGQVSYAGNYVGITNAGTTSGGALKPPPAGTDPAVLPAQPIQTSGTIFLNANFADNTVGGTIYNRKTVGSGSTTLENVDLRPGVITENGTFDGVANRPNLPDVFDQQVGTYAGVFGGTDASGVAGAISLDSVYDNTAHTKIDNLTERGIFVLNQCGLAGVPVAAGCKGTAP